MNQETDTRYFLHDYVSADKKKIVVNNEEYEVQLFQGKHSNEYLVCELKDGIIEGRCQLFNRGILSLSWTVKNGERIGDISVYGKGKAIQKESWKSFFSESERRVIENDKKGLVMTVRFKHENDETVIYRGEFDSDLNRHGRGVEYDRDSGKEKIEGYWIKDKLIRIMREFKDADEMIEYAECSDENIINRVPVYIGGYCIDNGSFLRNGVGYLINESSGTAFRESVWNLGSEISWNELHDGWYVEGMSESIRSILNKNESEESSDDMENNDITETFTVKNDEGLMEILNSNICVENLIIVSTVCSDLNILDFSQLKWLKVINIGDECFKNVNTFTISGLKRLQSLKIGNNSFTKNKNWYGEYIKNTFSLVNCFSLQSIEIGEYSFSDYAGLFELKNLPALQMIQIGKIDRWSNNFYRASFVIQGSFTFFLLKYRS